jgi:hypothetical protein
MFFYAEGRFCRVSQISPLSWVSLCWKLLCWVLLCWVSWRRFQLLKGLFVWRVVSYALEQKRPRFNSKQTRLRHTISRCDISLSLLFNNLLPYLIITGFHNPDPPLLKNTMPFGAKTTRANSALKQLLPLYFSIWIGSFLVLFKNMSDEK